MMASEEENKRKLNFCKMLADSRAQIHQKHAKTLATNVGEFHPEHSVSKDVIELKKQNIRNNLDYDEYVNMSGEWMWPKEAGETKLPPTNNNILGHVIARLRNFVHPPRKIPTESPLPHFSLKACVLGKLCTGKTSCLAKIAQTHGIHVLSAEELIKEAITAYNNREMATENKMSESSKEIGPKEDIEDLPQYLGNRNLSLRAMYGQEADQAMIEGNALPSELLVNVLLEAIQNIPANSGWILDGFPSNITLAHLLEKALGGNVEDECVVVNSQTNLVSDPDPPNPPPPSPPALDLALLLDISDDNAISRGVKLAYTAATESKPDYLFMSQIPQSIEAFQETWPKLEEWFGAKQNILIRIDANINEEELFNRVESVLLQAKRQLPEVVTTPDADDVAFNEELSEEISPQDLSSLDQSSFSLNNLKSTETSTNLNMVTGGKEHLQLDNQTVPSKKSLKSLNGHCSTYVGKPLPPGLPEALHFHWENICEIYVSNIKAVLQELRLENTLINQYLFNIKEDFKHYLGRPDSRQEIVDLWQENFNNVPDDMRNDDETKAELHLRLDELCERLWNISETKRDENKQERAAVMEHGWLSDHVSLLVNYHSILTQVELDRFRDTFYILKKYYLSMVNKRFSQPPSNLTTISLLNSSNIQDLETQIPGSNWQKKLLDDYEEAVTSINSLLPRVAQQREVQTEQTKETAKKPPNADKGCKKAPSAKKKSDSPPSPAPAPNPEPIEVKTTDHTMTEYRAVLSHEKEAAKVRIDSVKGHGLCLVDLIQCEAEQTYCCMNEFLEERFENETKSIEALAEVVHHYIESGAKLLNGLVLDGTHFYLNGDVQMIALPSSRSCPPPLEVPSQSTLTITQLESLCLQFRCVAPNRLLSYIDFSTLLENIMTATIGKVTLPGKWLKMTKAQLMQIEVLSKDNYEFVDWRRFILCCAQPWPSPSIRQLLDALRRLKAADIENKGYISEEKYLQTQLWFPKETVHETPEDLSKQPPYNCFSNLIKFFFQLFADHSFSPPRLNYTSMLLYLAADPNPKHGFFKALSVILGQHLKQSSLTQLIQSLPNFDGIPQFSSPELDVEFSPPESPFLSALLGSQKVSIAALLAVISHSSAMKDTQTEYTEQLVAVFKDLDCGPEDSVTFSVLSTHPFIQHLMETSTVYQLRTYSPTVAF